MFIAADTSFLIAFSAIQRMDLLRAAVGEVWIPPAVYEELVTDGEGWMNARQAQSEVHGGEWLRRWTVPFACLPSSSAKLGKGELEAVSLAFHNQGVCLVDERRGRAFAKSVGVRVVGSLGVLARCKKSGLIPAVTPLVRAMEESGIYRDPELVVQFLADLNE